MKRKFKEVGALIAFYSLILASAFIITARFNYLDTVNNTESCENIVVFNK